MKVRLSAGRPAPSYRSGPSARPAEVEENLTHPGMFYPNREPDTPLKCGCKIPWPIVQAFGGNIHGLVECSEHGWQPKITLKDIAAAKRAGKEAAKCQSTPDQLTMENDPPPF